MASVVGSTLYRVCYRTITREKAKGSLSTEFVTDMQTKIDLYSAANKITSQEYTELSTMLAEDATE